MYTYTCVCMCVYIIIYNIYIYIYVCVSQQVQIKLKIRYGGPTTQNHVEFWFSSVNQLSCMFLRGSHMAVEEKKQLHPEHVTWHLQFELQNWFCSGYDGTCSNVEFRVCSKMGSSQNVHIPSITWTAWMANNNRYSKHLFLMTESREMINLMW